ncbi:hypothetical protein BDAP_002645 [Binucleata daphniae]
MALFDVLCFLQFVVVTTVKTFFANRLSLFLLALTTINYAINIKNSTDPYELIFTALLSVINAVFESLQEHKNKNNKAKINNLLKTKTKKVVDDKLENSYDINIGDLIFIQPGDKIVCDILLTTYNKPNLPTFTKHVFVDESIFTGENYPVEKNVFDEEFSAKIYKKDVNIHNNSFLQKNKKYVVEAGSFIVKGCAYGFVFDNGKRFSKIKKKYEGNTKKDSEMVQEIKLISNKLVKTITVHCVMLFFVSLLININIIEAGKVCISLAITAIPEGLEIAVKICFSLACYKLMKKNVVIKDYRKIEDLANINVICTDKTGTLTKNEQKMENIYVCCEGKLIKLNKKTTRNYFTDPIFFSFFYHCIEVITVDSKTVGDPLDCAMYKHSLQYNQNKTIKLIEKKLFCHKKKYIKIKVIIKNQSYVLIKGAPKIILAKCKFDDKMVRESIMKKIKSLCKKAYRVIACAYKKEGEQTNDYKFVCVISFYDPPRCDVEQAVTWCKNNGVRIIVVTGDSKQTTKSICNKIGLLKSNSAIKQMIEAKKIKLLDQKDMNNICAVYRATPFDKLKLIEKIKTNENRLLMTGDGINDILAMQKSCVSFAMGSGADFCKEKSDAILIDDNFCNIILSIKTSRNSLHNVFCMLKYLISSNFGEIICISLCFFFKLKPCLVSRNLLLVNVLTDSVPAYLLFLNQPSTKKVQRKFDKAFCMRIIAIGVYIGCSIFGYYIYNLIIYNNKNICTQIITAEQYSRCTTNCTVYLICCEFINSLNNINIDSRSLMQQMYKENKYVTISAFVAPLLLFLSTHIPYTAVLLGFTPMKLYDMILVAFLVVPIYLIDYLMK